MDISQASQIVSGVADIAKDMLGDSVASCEVKIGGGWGSRVALWLHAHSKCGNVRCESGLIEPADVIELFVDWMGGEEKMAPGRFKQLERRVSDLFTDIGPTPAQVDRPIEPGPIELATTADRTLSIIKEKCKTGLRVARAQEGRSDDICHLNRMIGTIRVCERILGIIEGGGQ